MFKFIARLIGLFLLAGAMIAVIVDGAASIGASRIVIVPFGALWISAAPESLEAVRLFLVTKAHPFLWDPLLNTVLRLPTFVVLGILAFVFLWIGRRRHDPYAALDER